MLDLLKQCKNKKCKRFNTMFQPPDSMKYCEACGSRLKRWTEPSQGIAPSYARGYMGQPRLTGFVHGGPATEPSARLGEAFVGESACDVKGCPVAPDGGRVEIPWRLYNQWVYLAQQNDVEWIAYLKGSIEGSIYKLATDGMYFPEQKANGGHVEAADNSVEEAETIAAVHSHVDMSAFFSTEDEKHFNHAVELVVNRKGHVECVVRVQLECGRYQRAKAKVVLIEAEEAVSAQASLEKVLTVQSVAVTGYVVHDQRGVYGHGAIGYGELLDT